MEFRSLDRSEIEKLAEIDKSESVEYNYRCKEGNLELFEYRCEIGPYNEEQLRRHKDNLYDLFDTGGVVFGAFDGSRLVGISSLDSRFRGTDHKTLQLGLLHISKEYRKKGIGKKLVQLARDKAADLGAKRLYISCSPKKNTIEFYQAIGCRLAREVEKDLFELEPEDIHMELEL